MQYLYKSSELHGQVVMYNTVWNAEYEGVTQEGCLELLHLQSSFKKKKSKIKIYS